MQDWLFLGKWVLNFHPTLKSIIISGVKRCKFDVATVGFGDSDNLLISSLSVCM
jgi:hypothetical protein